jgi:hypothetical protein
VGGEVGTKTKLSPARASLLGLSLAKIPKIVATFVYASSQGQHTHSPLTKNQASIGVGLNDGYPHCQIKLKKYKTSEN